MIWVLKDGSCWTSKLGGSSPRIVSMPPRRGTGSSAARTMPRLLARAMPPRAAPSPRKRRRGCRRSDMPVEGLERALDALAPERVLHLVEEIAGDAQVMPGFVAPARLPVSSAEAQVAGSDDGPPPGLRGKGQSLLIVL